MSFQTLSNSVGFVMDGRIDTELTQVYASQTQYINGHTMCTPTCYLFCCGCVKGVFKSIPLTIDEMENLMVISSQVQTKLIQRCMGQHRMFSVTEVKKYIESPEGVRCIEVMGTVQDLPSDFINQFDDDEDVICIVTDLKKFIECMPSDSAIAITANYHTVALVNRNGKYWFFDPMVACIKEIECKQEALEFIIHNCIPRQCEEFTGLLVKKDPSYASDDREM